MVRGMCDKILSNCYALIGYELLVLPAVGIWMCDRVRPCGIVGQVQHEESKLATKVADLGFKESHE